jgi:hypothetical protein
LWPEKARRFWDAFPQASVLIDSYAGLLDENHWRAASQNKLVFRDLLWPSRVKLTNSDLEFLNLREELEGDEHTPKLDMRDISIGKLALVGTDGFLDSLRKNRERATRFMLFILEYVAVAGDSWRRREEVTCECNEVHTIVPCEWLAWIRRTAWVPRRRSPPDRLTTESLAVLTRNNPELAEAVTQREGENLLEPLGINVLDQALLGSDEANKLALRRGLSQLTKLVAKNPEEVEKLIHDIQARQKAGDQWRDNQYLGKEVERLVGETLRGKLRHVGIGVDTHFVGYDLTAYFQGTGIGEEDVGLIQVKAGTVLAKIKIKATRGVVVSMSFAQGEAATSDRRHYWFCVVQLPIDEPVSNLDQRRIEGLARFVPTIGDRLSPSRDDIEGARRKLPAAVLN